jgi:hypothetical protein
MHVISAMQEVEIRRIMVSGLPGKKGRFVSNVIRTKRARGMTQMVEHSPGKREP